MAELTVTRALPPLIAAGTPLTVIVGPPFAPGTVPETSVPETDPSSEVNPVITVSIFPKLFSFSVASQPVTPTSATTATSPQSMPLGRR